MTNLEATGRQDGNTSYSRVFDYDIVKTADPLEQTICSPTQLPSATRVTKFVRKKNGFNGQDVVIASPTPIDANLATIEDILPDAERSVACSRMTLHPTVPAGDLYLQRRIAGKNAYQQSQGDH